MVTPAKKCKPEQTSLWTNEVRMLGEKFYYLNKSTTKYVIVGLDHRSIRPIVRVCDRATGRYISINQSALESFVSVISAIVSGSYTLNCGCIVKSEPQIERMEFASIGNSIWQISDGSIEFACLQIHVTSLKNLVRIMDVIRWQIGLYDCDAFGSLIGDLKLKINGMTDSEIDSFLHNELKQHQNGYTEHQVLSDLICYRKMYR